MGKNLIVTIYETLKAFSIAIFIFCGVLTLIVLSYFWYADGSKQALAVVIFGVIGFYHFIKLIHDLKQIQKAGQE